jgi:hypothetical protein
VGKTAVVYFKILSQHLFVETGKCENPHSVVTDPLRFESCAVQMQVMSVTAELTCLYAV